MGLSPEVPDVVRRQVGPAVDALAAAARSGPQRGVRAGRSTPAGRRSSPRSSRPSSLSGRGDGSLPRGAAGVRQLLVADRAAHPRAGRSAAVPPATTLSRSASGRDSRCTPPCCGSASRSPAGDVGRQLRVETEHRRARASRSTRRWSPAAARRSGRRGRAAPARCRVGLPPCRRPRAVTRPPRTRCRRRAAWPARPSGWSRPHPAPRRRGGPLPVRPRGRRRPRRRRARAGPVPAAAGRGHAPARRRRAASRADWATPT